MDDHNTIIVSNQKKVDDHNTIIVLSDEDVMVLSIGEDECCHDMDPYDEWVINSAVSYHVTLKGSSLLHTKQET